MLRNGRRKQFFEGKKKDMLRNRRINTIRNEKKINHIKIGKSEGRRKNKFFCNRNHRRM